MIHFMTNLVRGEPMRAQYLKWLIFNDWLLIEDRSSYSIQLSQSERLIKSENYKKGENTVGSLNSDWGQWFGWKCLRFLKISTGQVTSKLETSLLTVKQFCLISVSGMVSFEPAWRADSFAPIGLSKYARSWEQSSFKNRSLGKYQMDENKIIYLDNFQNSNILYFSF